MKQSTTSFTLRIPDILLIRLKDSAANSDKPLAQVVIEACRAYLDGSQVQNAPDPVQSVPEALPKSEALKRALAIPGVRLGIETTPRSFPHEPEELDVFLAPCGHRVWQDGEQYECIAPKGHKGPHGLRGQFRKVEL